MYKAQLTNRKLEGSINNLVLENLDNIVTIKSFRIYDKIEKKYNKDVILENYLNTINLGAGSYGVQAASKKYFNKDVWDLNLSECATLAGITQNPTKFNPITNPKSNSKRRKEVLDHMLDQKYISQDEYNEA